LSRRFDETYEKKGCFLVENFAKSKKLAIHLEHEQTQRALKVEIAQFEFLLQTFAQLSSK